MAEGIDYEARAKMDTHEKVCAERYGSINQQLVTLHQRLNGMSDRMWAAAGGTILMALTAIGALVTIVLMWNHH
jgi:hypothetical protein